MVPESGGRRSTLVSYAAERVIVDGSTVVHRAQQRFFPAKTPEIAAAAAAVLGALRGARRAARLPDRLRRAARVPGRARRATRRSAPGGELTVNSLPRGDYRVSVDALGISSSRPVALSGDQRVRAAGDQLARHRRGPARSLGSLALGAAVRPPPGAASAAVACAVAALAGRRRRSAHRPHAPPSAPIHCSPTTTSGSTASSWDRAKIDYPRARALLERRPRTSCASTSRGRSGPASTASS